MAGPSPSRRSFWKPPRTVADSAKPSDDGGFAWRSASSGPSAVAPSARSYSDESQEPPSGRCGWSSPISFPSTGYMQHFRITTTGLTEGPDPKDFVFGGLRQPSGGFLADGQGGGLGDLCFRGSHQQHRSRRIRAENSGADGVALLGHHP